MRQLQSIQKTRAMSWPAALMILIATTLAVSGCGQSTSRQSTSGAAAGPNAPEVSPAGDIPDNQAFVAFVPPAGGFSLKVPEGWSRSDRSSTTLFTDKLNSIAIASGNAKSAPTVASVKAVDVPKLARSASGFKLQSVSKVTRSAGPAIRTTYLATGKADAVTGKKRTIAVERYSFHRNGKTVVLTLSGAKGADNVDPWKIVTSSFAWR